MTIKSCQNKAENVKKRKIFHEKRKNGSLMLFFMILSRSFANKKLPMKTIVDDRDLGIFMLLAESGQCPGDEERAFGKICASLGIREEAMDRYLYDNFGLPGKDILRSYGCSVPVYML